MAAASVLPSQVVFENHTDWFPTYIADLLSAPEAMSFCTVARKFRVLRLKELTATDGTLPHDWERNQSWHGSRDVYYAHRWQVPVSGVVSSISHTAFVSLRWRDQGWGNQKGMISVVDEGSSGRLPQYDNTTSAWTGPHAPNDYKTAGAWVVSANFPAPHRDSPLKVSFPVVDTSVYSLWYRVGGGGGHSLTVSDCRVFVLEKVVQ
jgi:hypothetical protein